MNCKVAAVIVTYNRLELLKECIDSLRNQARKLNNIIVINNSSTDGTFEWLESQNDLTTVTQKNTGSSGGQYTGIKLAYDMGYEWIWCMDDDAGVKSDALLNLVKFAEQGVLALAPRVIDEENKTLLAHRGRFNLNKIRKGDVQIPTSENDYTDNDYFVVDFASFVGIMLHRKVIEKIGLPNKDFFIYHDDVEYCLRISLVSKIGVVTNSTIVHKISNKKNYESKKMLFWESERPLIKRYGVECILYRNLFYIYANYYPKMVFRILSVAFNYFVLFRRIMIYDRNKFLRIRLMTKAVIDGLQNKFNNDYYLSSTWTKDI